jgi:hypothetical protein
MKLTDKGVSDQLVADMRTMLEGHLSEAPFNATAALKKQRIKGMQDKLAIMRKNRERADETAEQAREQGRDNAADAAEAKGDRINRNIQDFKEKIKKEMEEQVSEDNTNDKSDDGEGLDKVKKDAVKKKFADRKDKDIDNDGDSDSSDEYLHKKRQAISKKMDEGELPPALKKAIDKKKGKDDDEEEVEEDVNPKKERIKKKRAQINQEIDRAREQIKSIEKQEDQADKAGDNLKGARLSVDRVGLYHKIGHLEDKLEALGKQMKRLKEGKLPPALQKAIDKKKGKDTDDDEKEVEEGKDKIKYRGNLKDLKAMKEDFNVLINKYGFETVKKIINSVS